MADAIISVVVERVTAIIEKQIRNEVNLVRGAEKEVLNLSSELKKIRNVLDDADRRGFQDKSIQDWLKRLEDTSYEMDDVLDEWDIAVLRLQMELDQSNDVQVRPCIPSSCLCYKKVTVRLDIAKKIRNVKGQLDQILAEKDRYDFVMSEPTNPSAESWRVQSTSLVDLAEVHGRDFDRDILVSKLMSNGGRQEELGINVMSIVGVGGVGKTTLAQMIYNDSRVKKNFELRIWLCVSDPFDVAGIAKGIVESVQGSSPNLNQLEMILQRTRDSISGKRFLLVLDDVWTQDYKKWEPLKDTLKYGGAGSKILVTTRNERVAKMMGTTENDIHHLGQLSNDHCWLLLHRMAILGRKEEEFKKFEYIGKEIAYKCKGLPLAAKVLGSLLRFKSSLEEWESVLNSEIWQLEEVRVDLFPHMLLSYNELSPALKCCFSYCAIFSKDSKIDVEKLIGNWMALGYLGPNIGSGGDMELKGREFFQNLAMRSLFQDFRKDDLDEKIQCCKMHDMVHDFAQFLRKNGRVDAAEMKKATCQDCTPLLVSNAKEYRSLVCGKHVDAPQKICDCLTSLRVFGMARCKLGNIPQGMESLIHLKWLDLSENNLSGADLKTICKLYNLQTLLLRQCELEEISREIGNLIDLRHLDLSSNYRLKELPESICGLHELRTLNVDICVSLGSLPEGIHRLINLKQLHANLTHNFPQGVAQLTGLRTLSRFHGGSGWSKLGLLKNLNLLCESLQLHVNLRGDLEEVVKDAWRAELRKKIHIQMLEIEFDEELEVEAVKEKQEILLDALEPHPNLQRLRILCYKGSKLPRWIISPLNQLRNIRLEMFGNMPSLPPLEKLPCLEVIYIGKMSMLEFVGREFLGLTKTIGGGGVEGNMDNIQSSSSEAAAATNTNFVAFPKLKELTFYRCYNWKEWEDITAEEEESASMSLMPCLTELRIELCGHELEALPHRLLRKASSTLEKLNFYCSTELVERYKDKDGPGWKLISQNNPRLRLWPS